MRELTLAATQFACSWDLPANADRAEALIRRAAGEGAQVVLIQELFAAPYFCITERAEYLALAQPFEGHPLIARFAALARDLGVVLPVSFFERAGTAHFNSVAMIDADGRVLGRYRKSHIPQGPGYEEKYYFSPGDTGFRVWDTAHGTDRRRDLLGPVVPGSRPRHGAAGRRGAALPDRDRLGTARAGL